MSMTLAEATSIISRRIRAEESSPGPSSLDIHENTVSSWLNELTSQVVEMLRHDPANYKEFQSLIIIDAELTLNAQAIGSLSAISGSGSGENIDVVLTVKCDSDKIKAEITYDPHIFAAYDSAHWLLETTPEKPIALIANDKIYVKPVHTYALKNVYVDYCKVHPTISSTQGTVFSPKGDDILIELFMAHYYSYFSEGDSDGVFARLADLHYQKAIGLTNVPNIFANKKIQPR